VATLMQIISWNLLLTMLRIPQHWEIFLSCSLLVCQEGLDVRLNIYWIVQWSVAPWTWLRYYWNTWKLSFCHPPQCCFTSC
jgi:hypothetical protein